MKTLKRKRTWSHNKPTHGSKTKAKKARREPRPGVSDSDEEDVTKSTVRIPGVIEKLDITHQGKPAGVVSFCLKTGKKHLGLFLQEETVVNGFTLKTMRQYASDNALGFPFEVGKDVHVIGYKQKPSLKFNVSHKVWVEIGDYSADGKLVSLEDLSEKAITNLDGSEFVGEVKAFDKESGVASFKLNGTVLLTHFNVIDVTLGGQLMPKACFSHVLYNGMQVLLKITSSNSTSIPGLYYTASAKVNVLLASGFGDAGDEMDTFKGVILTIKDSKQAVISCSCKDNKAQKFFAVCDPLVTDRGPVSQSDLHFGEGTNILCSLKFKYNYGNIISGCVYQASAVLPLKLGKIVEIMEIMGSFYPHKVLTEIESEKRQVIITRGNVRVNGKVPGSSFPKTFFQSKMAVHLNDVWKMNASETHATLDISTNVIIRRNAIREAAGTTATASESPSLDAVDSDDRREPKRAPPMDGVVSATRANDQGLLLPSEVDVIIDNVGHTINIAPSQVLVNSKSNRYLPPSYVRVGDAVKLYNIKLCKDTNMYTATINYFYPKSELKKAWDEFKQRHVDSVMC